MREPRTLLLEICDGRVPDRFSPARVCSVPLGGVRGRRVVPSTGMPDASEKLRVAADALPTFLRCSRARDKAVRVSWLLCRLGVGSNNVVSHDAGERT